MNGYPKHVIESTNSSRTQHPTMPHPQNTKWLYLTTPYISDNLDLKLKDIFKQEGINVRIVHKSSSLRQALKPKSTPAKCTLKNCTIASTKLCFKKCVVYKITCSKCHSIYIGSTIRHLHDRIKEHTTSSKSSIYKHINTCQCTKETLLISIIDNERDPLNLRLLEAFYIKKNKPTINSREESSELDLLLF